MRTIHSYVGEYTHKNPVTIAQKLEHVMEYIQSGCLDMLPSEIEFHFKGAKSTHVVYATIKPNDNMFYWRKETENFIQKHMHDIVDTYMGVYRVSAVPNDLCGEPERFICEMLLK